MPPQLIDVAAGDGHRFQLRRHEGEGGPGLLWIPALGVAAAKYDACAAALADRGVDVVVHEWRGLGSSSWRAGRGCDWDYRALLADLAATRAALPGARRWHYGGHSLGAQFAAMLAARQPKQCAGLVLVAGGLPAPATFAGPYRHGLALLARLMPALVAPLGYFPGRTLKFAGREAAGVMRDWAASALRGGYADYGDGVAMDRLLAATTLPALGVLLRDDWMAPAASLRALLAKLGEGTRSLLTLAPAELGVDADHFRWMRAPDPVATRIAAWLVPVSS